MLMTDGTGAPPQNAAWSSGSPRACRAGDVAAIVALLTKDISLTMPASAGIPGRDLAAAYLATAPFWPGRRSRLGGDRICAMTRFGAQHARLLRAATGPPGLRCRPAGRQWRAGSCHAAADEGAGEVFKVMTGGIGEVAQRPLPGEHRQPVHRRQHGLLDAGAAPPVEHAGISQLVEYGAELIQGHGVLPGPAVRRAAGVLLRQGERELESAPVAGTRGATGRGRWLEATLQTAACPPRWLSGAIRAHAVVVSVITPAEVLIAAWAMRDA
jgi:hypothetical protein